MNVELPPDFADLLVALVEAGAEFLVVGGYAVAHYGHPRATKDIDVFVRAERGNAERVVEALASFGAPLRALGIDVQDFERVGQTVQLGVAPYRIDLLTEIDGVSFERAWAGRERFALGAVEVPVISLGDLLANKRASGRPQDLVDVAALEASSEGSRGDGWT
jgi:hypothetical protein